MITSKGEHTYQYDDNNQLTSSFNPETVVSENFTYDEIGNRKTDNGGSYTYDSKKQRLDEDYRYRYYYDDNGNLSSKQAKVGNEALNYIHNTQNQLIRMEWYDSTTLVKKSEYTYDVIGRRVEKIITDIQDSSKSLTRRFVYDGNEILHMYDENNSLLSTYTHSTLRTDDVLAVDVTSDGVSKKVAKASGTMTYLKDGLGSVIDITDEAGAISQHYIYTSFGTLSGVADSEGTDISASPKLTPMYTYTNRELDNESGMYYYRARYYDAGIGRFIQEDPHPGNLTNPLATINKYSYVNNNPANMIDPSGRIAFLTCVAIGAVIGGVTFELSDRNFLDGVLLGALAGAAAWGSITYGGTGLIFKSSTAEIATLSAISSSFQSGNLMVNFLKSFTKAALIDTMFGALKEFIATPANAKELSTSISSNPKVMMGFVSNPNYIPSYTEAKALNDLQSTVDAFEEFTNIILFLKQTSEWSK